jgi:hypothetical protein
MMDIGIEGELLCVEKITSAFMFLSYCLEFEILSLVFVFAAESEMNFKMPSEI